jgi:hypothetical protein
MSNYPEKTCSLDRLITQPRLVVAALEGKKTQQRRNGVYGYPGETFELQGVSFVVKDLVHQRLDDMTEQDAHAEGFDSLATYKEIISQMHGGMEWNGNAKAWVHSFEMVKK